MPTEATSSIDLIPSGEPLAVEVIAELIGEGYTSSLLKLPRPVLNELARQIVTDWPVSEKLEEWLAGKGHDVPGRNIRRFVKRFKEKYSIVVGKHVNAQIAAELADDPRFDSDKLRRVSRNRIQHAIAHELLTTAPEDLDTQRLATFIRGIRLEDIRDHDTESLAIARDLAESRIEKLEADHELDKQQADQRERKLQSDLALSDERVKKLQLDNEALERKHRQALEAAKAETAALAASTDNGNESGKLSEADVLAILDRAMKGEL